MSKLSHRWFEHEREVTAQIVAADAYVDRYEQENRPFHVPTDIRNAFYAGVAWQKQRELLNQKST